MSNASLELGGGKWGTKDGNLLGYASSTSSSKFVPREFTFTRGSDIAATRISSSGVIEKYRENLLLQSNQFDTTWSSANASVTNGQLGYDGSNNAWLLGLDYTGGQGSYLRQEKSISGVNTFSIYAKKGSNDGIYVEFATGNYPNIKVDLSDGSLISTNGTINTKIESVGNGWYRVSMSINQSLARVNIRSVNGSGINTTGNIYIQDAQVEQGLVATSYLESGATTATSGVADNEPRIDYAGGTANLLLEPSRTNLMIHSEYLSGLSLSGNPPIITQNYAVSPEGVQNAARVQDTDATNFKIIQTQFSITAGSTYTISVYVKKATSPISTYGGFYFDFDGGTRKTSNLIFDEYNGTLVNATGNAITSVIHPVIDEGDYWRFSATATDTGSNNLLRPTLRAGASANGTSLSLVTKDYTAYGFQCEEGSYPTSYIPTYGTSVTRNQDQASFAYDAAATSWSVFMDVKNWTDVSNSGQFSFSNIADTTNSLFYYGACFGVQKSVGQEYSCGKLSNYEVYNGKFAITYDGVNTVKIYIDGVLRDTITTADTAKTAGIDGGNLYYAGSPASKEIKSLLLFPTALTDREAVDLTSPYSTYQELVTAEGLTWESPTCTTNSITELQSI